jgi:hypothetical protein
MAMNPMQRKARNSFLMGFLLMLVIAALIIGILVMVIINQKKEEQSRQQSIKKVYVLTQNIKSGEQITSSSYKLMEVSEDYSPTDTSIDFSKKLVAKIDLTMGTVLSKSMLTEDDNKITSDIRLQEYNMITLPVYLYQNDYIDIRLMLPSGQDYIVISRKKVANVEEHTLWLELSEEEILTMSNAIVEAYTMTGSILYATLYVEPGIQVNTTPTYPVNKEVLSLIQSNPNIVSEARRALIDRYTQAQIDQRNNNINGELQKYSDEAKQNIENKVKEQMEKSRELREKYLETLSGTTTGVN